MQSELFQWLLDSDPTLRWQVERDLLNTPQATWLQTKSEMLEYGFARQLLDVQDEDGQWAGGSYFPKEFDFKGPEAAPGAGQPWTATTWSLNALREWGVEASVLGDTASRLALNSRWDYDGSPYWNGEVDCCINGYTLANGAWLGADVEGIAQWFIDHQLEDGGWNCDWVDGAKRSSVNSTLNALRGILYHETKVGGSPELKTARERGEEYLLRRRLMFKENDGELIAPWITELTYPFRWRYTILNALDYFRISALHEKKNPDARLVDVINSLKEMREPDGTWIQQTKLKGRVWFEVDSEVGEPSKWLTFYALRAIAWWQDASSTSL